MCHQVYVYASFPVFEIWFFDALCFNNRQQWFAKKLIASGDTYSMREAVQK